MKKEDFKDITKEHIISCKQIIKDGNCNKVSCTVCPFTNSNTINPDICDFKNSKMLNKAKHFYELFNEVYMRDKIFIDAKEGDRVWDFLFGWGTVIGIYEDENHLPIEVMFEFEDRTHSYGLDGKRYAARNQTLFWDEIKFEIPKKPFDLEVELRKLEVKEFIDNENNFYLVWHSKKNSISCEYRSYAQQPLGKYFTEKSIKDFMENIKNRSITKEQFFAAYKKVFNNLI